MGKAVPRLSFCIHDRAGKLLAFSVVSIGWLHYEVPFDQWRGHELSAAQIRVLDKLELRSEYEHARKRLGAVLYQARVNSYFFCHNARQCLLFALGRPRQSEMTQASANSYSTQLDYDSDPG